MYRQLRKLSLQQAESTATRLGKLWQFFKISILGYPNSFEALVKSEEPNDNSLVAKYFEVVDIDLSEENDLSVDEVSLANIRIPHPLVNFLHNEVNQSTAKGLNLDEELEESPILFFIHGMGGQMAQFSPLIALLSQCLEIAAIDLPGFGHSKIEFSDNEFALSNITVEEKKRISSGVRAMRKDYFSTDNVVKILLRYVDQTMPKNKKIVLVGHSMGTHLAVKLAKILPKGKVEGLILLAPPALKHQEVPSKSFLLSLLKTLSHTPFLFNMFRVWDRLEGLESTSVHRQLGFERLMNFFIKLRQLRWNLDINSNIVLNYAHGFSAAKYSDLVAAIQNLNDNPKDRKTYQKTLVITGGNDKVTPSGAGKQIVEYLSQTFQREVASHIEISHAGHALLLMKPEFVSGKVLNHIEDKFPARLHLSPAWVLKLKAEISGDKWGLKNELKWSKTIAISKNIVRGEEVSPLLAMKTLRQDDKNHSPEIVESLFHGPELNTKHQGDLIAIVDISHDIPPYDPKLFKHIKYYKCSTVSKVVPDQNSIRKFTTLVEDILANSNKEKPLVAVHCHYGFNRTGYLICCYLIEKLGWTVQEAVHAFNVAREPGIKHQHFIDALYVRYESF